MSTLNSVATVKGSIEHRDNADERLEFYFNPEEINFRSSASWAKHKIAGVHDPRLQYAGGEGTLIDFRLHLIQDPQGAPINVDDQVRWLESLVFPAIDTESLRHREPPRVSIFFGKGRGNYSCVVEDVEVIHRLFHSDLRTRYAEVEIKAIVDRVQARGWGFVRNMTGAP